MATTKITALPAVASLSAGDVFEVVASGVSSKITKANLATQVGSSGTVTHTAGALTLNEVMLGAGAADSKALGSLGTATTVLHGNAAGAPTFGAVSLTADVTGDLPYANLVQASAASKLVGRGSASGAGDFQEITLGTGLTMTATTLSASGGTGTVTATGGSLTSNSVVLGAGTTDTKVAAGIITDGTSKVTLGVAGTSVGSIDLKNATSGTITLQPVTGALGTVTATFPAATTVMPVISQLLTFSGPSAARAVTLPDEDFSVGFRNIPQNSKSAAYTTVLADAGKHIFHPSGDANARTFTIDSNANVAYALGTAITFINRTSQVVTIAITSDTLTLAGTTTTGSRSLAQNGIATAVKDTTTGWLISGTGLT